MGRGSHPGLWEPFPTQVDGKNFPKQVRGKDFPTQVPGKDFPTDVRRNCILSIILQPGKGPICYQNLSIATTQPTTQNNLKQLLLGWYYYR